MLTLNSQLAWQSLCCPQNCHHFGRAQCEIARSTQDPSTKFSSISHPLGGPNVMRRLRIQTMIFRKNRADDRHFSAKHQKEEEAEEEEEMTPTFIEDAERYARQRAGVNQNLLGYHPGVGILCFFLRVCLCNLSSVCLL